MLRKKVRIFANAVRGVFFRQKIFCISIQRTGTTSVGQFLIDHGIPTAGQREADRFRWNYFWKIGNYDAIFKSLGFKLYRGFQDGPWWAGDFYKYIYHKYPNSKFILVTRDSTDWFNSMLSHSGLMNPGNTHAHCKIYGRIHEYVVKYKLDFSPDGHKVDNKFSLDGMSDLYKNYYDAYNEEAIQFFRFFGGDNFCHVRLEDDNKWKKIGDFLDIVVKDSYSTHQNASL
jgi:hypothetical protein